MALTHDNAIRNTLANTVGDAVDAGTTNPNGNMQFLTAGQAQVASIECQNPAFDDAPATAVGQITLLGTPLQDTNADGGTMAEFRFRDRDDNEVFRGTVGTSGEDVNFPGGVVVQPGDIVEISAFTYTASL